jgi:two-component system, cell cycle response regulator
MRIVLVDPSRIVTRMVSSLIRPWQHEVFEFVDGAEALEAIRTDGGVDAVITSAELSTMSGIDLCTQARILAGARRPLYIILMSCNNDNKNLIMALENGADDYIHKPPVVEELRARLRAAERMLAMQRDLIRLASTDYLTGLLNRRAFFEQAMDRWPCSASETLSVIMCDIDHFKKINDTLGHDAGDVVLRTVAQQLAQLDGIVGRLGGEEFCILVNEPLDDALDIAEALRRTLSVVRCRIGKEIVQVTCSLGVAEWEGGDTIDCLLRRADMALYEAKLTGRNRVVAADTYSTSKGHEDWRGTARIRSRRPGVA